MLLHIDNIYYITNFLIIFNIDNCKLNKKNILLKQDFLKIKNTNFNKFNILLNLNFINLDFFFLNINKFNVIFILFDKFNNFQNISVLNLLINLYIVNFNFIILGDIIYYQFLLFKNLNLIYNILNKKNILKKKYIF